MKEGFRRVNWERRHIGSFLPNWLLEDKAMGLSLFDKVVWARLTQYQGSHKNCWPSLSTLAKACTMARSTIQESIAKLVDAGLVDRQEKTGASNSYSCCEPKWIDVPPDGTENTGTRYEVYRETVPNNNNKSINKTDTSSENLKEVKRKQEARMKRTKTILKSKIKTPVTELKTIFNIFWMKNKNTSTPYRFADKEIPLLRRLYAECYTDNPKDPKGVFAERLRLLFRDYDIKNFFAVGSYWSRAIPVDPSTLTKRQRIERGLE